MRIVERKEKPRILFFLPTLLGGGAELHALDLCENLRDAGFDCRILAHGPQISDAAKAKPVTWTAIRLKLRGMSDPWGWVRIWRLLRKIKPDIIVCINQTMLIVSVIEKLAFGTKAALACIFHSTEMQSYESYQETPFRICARFADLLVFVGREQQRVWEERGVRARRVRLIENGIDLARFSPSPHKRAEARVEFGFDADDYVLGIVAGFRPEKNHGELLAALARARQLGSRAKVLAVGEGPTLPEIKALAEKLGVVRAIVFTGPRTDVDRLVCACDVGVLCSTAESFPLAALEFLASGAPMLVSAIGGMFEVVKPQINGLAYEPGNVEQLAANIVEMENPQRRAELARHARESTRRFSVDAMTAAYVEEFDKLHV